MTTTRYNFRLSFLTDSNSTKVINVPRANSTLDAAAIADAMTAIIDSDAVRATAHGIPTSRFGAELVTTTQREIDLFPAA